MHAEYNLLIRVVLIIDICMVLCSCFQSTDNDFDSETEKAGEIVDSGTDTSNNDFDSETDKAGKIVDSGTDVSKNDFDSRTEQDGEIVDSGTDTSKNDLDSETENDGEIVDSESDPLKDAEDSDGEDSGENVVLIIDIPGYPPFTPMPLELITSIRYAVTGDGEDISGVIATPNQTSQYSHTVTLPAGKDYLATATADIEIGQFTCQGVSDPFDVEKGVETRVHITMFCINTEGYQLGCPAIGNHSYNLPDLPVGVEIQLFATSDAADATFQWTGPGVFSDASSRNPSFVCDTEGPQTITISVGSQSIARCNYTRAIGVNCLNADEQLPFKELEYSVYGSNDFLAFGHLGVETDANGIYADLGEMAPGEDYRLGLRLSESWTTCGLTGNGSSSTIPFSVIEGETSEITAVMSCDGYYVGDIHVTVRVQGGADPCNHFTATPSQTQVGEYIDLSWDKSRPIESELGYTEDSIVGTFVVDSNGLRYQCLSPGIQTLSLSIIGGPCLGFKQNVEVTCVAREEQNCCPIEVFSDEGCVEFGGSPPCFTGCECLRNGGGIEAVFDENDCLMWKVTDGDRYEEESSNQALCLDGEGNPHPDPRVSCGSYAPSGMSPESPCRGSDVSPGLDPYDTVCSSSEGRSCDPSGTWRISFSELADPPTLCIRDRPPLEDIELDAPNELEVSENGCELTYIHSEGWSNGESGTYGYSLFLQIDEDGETARGAFHMLECGFCFTDFRMQVEATRVR